MADAVIGLFDRVADSYDEVLPFFREVGRRYVSGFLDDPPPGARLLDVGAGRGAIAVPASLRGYDVTAVDASTEMVKRLRDDHPGLDARVMDAARLEFGDGSFDVVTAGFVLHILDDPAAALREIRRVLKPGGVLAFTGPGRVPDGFEFADGINALFAEFAQYLPPGGSMGTPFDAAAELRAAGFTGITEDHIDVELPVSDPDQVWRWLQTHGSLKFFDDLPPARRAEFRTRLIADLKSREPLVLRRYVWLHRARAAA